MKKWNLKSWCACLIWNRRNGPHHGRIWYDLTELNDVISNCIESNVVTIPFMLDPNSPKDLLILLFLALRWKRLNALVAVVFLREKSVLPVAVLSCMRNSPRHRER